MIERQGSQGGEEEDPNKRSCERYNEVEEEGSREHDSGENDRGLAGDKKENATLLSFRAKYGACNVSRDDQAH